MIRPGRKARKNIIQREIESGDSASAPGFAAAAEEIAAPPEAAPQLADISWSMDEKDIASEEAAVDLQSLARQVFPIVKRLLALEKERSTGRSF